MHLSIRYGKDRMITTFGISVILHIALVVILSLNPFTNVVKVRPSPLTVTLMPVSFQEPPIQKSIPITKPKDEQQKIPLKIKPLDKPKKDDIVEKVKKPLDKESLKRLQEALEEIRKKAAIDEIKKRVELRERNEETPIQTQNQPTITPPRPSIINPRTTSPSYGVESKLNEYYNLIWAKIKEAWTLPENLIKDRETIDLETIIVLVIERDGKIQRWWFEKKSGNELYDQMAARAIKKAEPFQPIPKELNEKSLEVGIRFSQE